MAMFIVTRKSIHTALTHYCLFHLAHRARVSVRFGRGRVYYASNARARAFLAFVRSRIAAAAAT